MREPTLHLGWCITTSTNSTSGEGERRLWQRAYITEHKLSLSEVQAAAGQQLSNNSARKSQSRFTLWLAAEAWIGFQITWGPSVSLQARLSGIWSKLRPPGASWMQETLLQFAHHESARLWVVIHCDPRREFLNPVVHNVLGNANTWQKCWSLH